MTNEPLREDSQPAAAPPRGPYLQHAFFCEKILQEGSVMSFIRQIDRVTMTIAGPDILGQEPPKPPYTCYLAIAFKSGEARGSHRIKVVRQQPSGLRDDNPLLNVDALFEGEDRGVGFQGPITIGFENEGLYWFDVYVDDTLMTRMPFRVIFQRAILGPAN